MKKHIKRAASALLAAATVVSSFFAVMPANAAEEPMKFIYVQNDETGEYGVQNYRYVDENGNEVNVEGDSLSTCSTESADLPAAYDSRDKGYITEPKMQGLADTCWAFASTSLLESDSIIKGYETLETADYSEAHLAWFTGRSSTDNTEDSAYGDGYSYEEPFKQGGNWKRAAVTLSRWSGLADESEYPFCYYDLSKMGDYSESDRYNTSGGVVLESAQELRDSDDMKQWIIDHGSATAAFYYSDTYFNSSTSAYCCAETGVINHQIVIVGWDDAYPASNFNAANVPAADGAWLCKNSWSENWGDGGYFWLSYFDTSINLTVGFTAQSSEDYYKNYIYNGTDWNSAYLRSTATQIANVFTASGHEKLTAVATYTVGTDISVKVTVFKNLPEGYSTPIAGTQAAYTETVIEREGYHTIYLDTEVLLEPGEIFSVVVELYSGGGYTYVPVEMNPLSDQTFGSREGESYLNLNASRKAWQSASRQGINNVYIQAFTKCNHQLTAETDDSTCVNEGSEKVFCSQCGKIESERVLALSDHEFGEWNDFAYNSDAGVRVSEKICAVCGASHQRAIQPITVVTLDSFMELFFSRLSQILKAFFAFTA